MVVAAVTSTTPASISSGKTANASGHSLLGIGMYGDKSRFEAIPTHKIEIPVVYVVPVYSQQICAMFAVKPWYFVPRHRRMTVMDNVQIVP